MAIYWTRYEIKRTKRQQARRELHANVIRWFVLVITLGILAAAVIK